MAELKSILLDAENAYYEGYPELALDYLTEAINFIETKEQSPPQNSQKNSPKKLKGGD